MLWAYALVIALFYFIGNNAASLSKIFLIAFSFSVALEILQVTPIAEGTFDLYDITVEFLAEIIAVFIIKILFRRREENEKEDKMDSRFTMSWRICNDGFGKWII